MELFEKFHFLKKNEPDSTMIDVSGTKFPEELLGPDRLEVVDEKLPELEDVVPAEVVPPLNDYDLIVHNTLDAA
jgi:hypothetical protein